MTYKLARVEADNVSNDAIIDALKSNRIDPENINIDDHVSIEPSNGGFDLLIDVDPDEVATGPKIIVKCLGCGETYECESLVNVREHHQPGYEFGAYCRNPEHDTWLTDVVITARIQ